MTIFWAACWNGCCCRSPWQDMTCLNVQSRLQHSALPHSYENDKKSHVNEYITWISANTLTSATNSSLSSNNPSPEQTMQTSPPAKTKHLKYLSLCLSGPSSGPPQGHRMRRESISPAALGVFLPWLWGRKGVKHLRQPSARYSGQSESSLLYSNSIDQPEGDSEQKASQAASNQDNRHEDAGSNSVCVCVSHPCTDTPYWLSLVPRDGKQRQCIHHWY